MQKKLKYKLVALFTLCAALMAVSSPPRASASTGGPFCLPAPVDSGCDFFICCDSDGNCFCG
jgi:hypothetical protein